MLPTTERPVTHLIARISGHRRQTQFGSSADRSVIESPPVPLVHRPPVLGSVRGVTLRTAAGALFIFPAGWRKAHEKSPSTRWFARWGRHSLQIRHSIAETKLMLTPHARHCQSSGTSSAASYPRARTNGGATTRARLSAMATPTAIEPAAIAIGKFSARSIVFATTIPISAQMMAVAYATFP